MSHSARIAGFSAVSTALALLSDRQLGSLVAEAPLVSSGIGGTGVLLQIADRPVFAKAVPLTDLERRPENLRWTANLFQLPTFLQYGVGSVGFGVWRELAAHVMTTNWVLARECESFPLMYHWRVVPGPPPRTPGSAAEADVEGMVAYWDGSATVRDRLTAMARASASVVLFLEYVPQTLQQWLTAQAAAGDDAIEAACTMVDQRLRADVLLPG